MPDFSARERTYQLLSQALGRVGRGHVAGHAIIQTYHPESPTDQAAIDDNWDRASYQSELTERRPFHFPTVLLPLKLSCRRASYKSAETTAQKFKDKYEPRLPEIDIDGPTPSFHEKVPGQIPVSARHPHTQRSKLLEVIKLLPPSGWTYDIDPINLL